MRWRDLGKIKKKNKRFFCTNREKKNERKRYLLTYLLTYLPTYYIQQLI